MPVLCSQIAAKPGARHFRCLFRVMFVPRDAFDLLNEDPVAFEYFYMQVKTYIFCINQIVKLTSGYQNEAIDQFGLTAPPPPSPLMLFVRMCE